MYKHRISAGFILFVYILVALSCSGNVKKSEIETAQQEASVMEVSIEGMFCLGCEQTIQMNVSKLEGIKSVKASFTDGNAIIEYFPGKVDTLEIRDAVTGSGYTVKKCIPVQGE
jgi:copper chaperone CopZ